MERAISHPFLFSRAPRKARPKRDPYDGLRPWSAITHGGGAALSMLGTVLLLTRAAGRPLHFWAFAIYGYPLLSFLHAT